MKAGDGVGGTGRGERGGGRRTSEVGHIDVVPNHKSRIVEGFIQHSRVAWSGQLVGGEGRGDVRESGVEETSRAERVAMSRER